MNKTVFACIFGIFLFNFSYASDNIDVNLTNDNLQKPSDIQLHEDDNKLDYDFSSTLAIPIELSPVENINTKEGIIEGTEIKLKVRKTVKYKGKIVVKKDDLASAKIETYITKGMNGFPSELVIENFKIDNIKDSKILGKYRKDGANRVYWVYPLKWALTPIPFVGSFTNLILGGEVYLKTTDVITIYYFPEWK